MPRWVVSYNGSINDTLFSVWVCPNQAKECMRHEGAPFLSDQ